jgi:hypothetical protein
VKAEFAELVATIVCAPAAVPVVYRPVELIVPTVGLPPGMLSTLHVAGTPPGTVAVNCCVRVKVRAAAFGATLIVTLDTVTIAVTAALVPVAPVQVKE